MGFRSFSRSGHKMGITRYDEGQRGATLVEAAIVVPLFFLLVFGLLEFGLGFKDWLTLNHGAREGARVSVAAADDIRTDQLALEALEKGLVGNMMSAVVQVEIANADDDSLVNVYTPNPGDPCGWSPCPNPDLNPGFEATLAWPPSARNVIAPNVDRVRVSIVFVHDYVTGFVGDDATWTASKEMRIEPQG